MKALVIGATGIIGNHVVRALIQEGIQVRALSRGLTPSLNLQGLDVERVRGDINDPASLKSALKGCSWVFHAAGYYPTHTFQLKKHVHRAGMEIQNILNAVSSSPIDRLIYTSSMTTIGPAKSADGLADESCSYSFMGCPPHPYFAVKYLMEEEVRKRAAQGLPAVIVNPTGCLGPFELKPPNLCLMPQMARGRVPVLVEGKINVVPAVDVGRGHVLAAKKGRIGERYLLGGINMQVSQLMRTIADIVQIKLPDLKIPLKIALIPSWISEAYGFIFHQIPPLPLLGLRFIQYGQYYNLSKSTKELDYHFSSVEKCLAQAHEWFKKIGYYSSKKVNKFKYLSY